MNIPAGQNRQVLVIDDSDVVRPLIVSMLLDAGYVVFEAATCEHAHGILAAQKISAAVCDFSLAGGRNGVDCLQSVLRLHPGVKCILMSGHFSVGKKPELPFPVISKPFDAAEILALLEELLDSRGER